MTAHNPHVLPLLGTVEYEPGHTEAEWFTAWCNTIGPYVRVDHVPEPAGQVWGSAAWASARYGKGTL